MARVLLRGLNRSDIDWLIEMGQQEVVAAGTILIQQGKFIDQLYIVLDGILTVTVSQAERNDPLALALSALEDNETTEWEVARLSNGEIIGERSLLETAPASASVKALRKSLVLAIPRQQLAIKLQRDMKFAVHFYRAMAILLSNRLQGTVNQTIQSL
ncbi:cyclic nucleotide-binding domain-containing protein [Leptolyngbya sp. FACHB-261]|uniref:cyclic nucleotide-binding domain-containing protein n=1 Tax=Leptolyngbya sp. FACHB-261 TaxID=2692806 RepID=UPI0016824D7A|nr:cyclic nucleotide-binding domain-containing protein [Leptolyngbya sp. FACHB-261]MBD2104015.1 cyclic nucleotide-binding domain-containing protein [Leptolyngbya sp. FACHB-261]